MDGSSATEMVIVQVAPDVSEPSVHVTAFTTCPHTPEAEVTLVTVMKAGAGTLSVTCTFAASEGPLFVTTIV